jgi:DNA-binding Lrp family transcriptional regulator
MSKTSNIPNKIITYLQSNPAASREEIGKALGVSYQAVQKNLQKLAEDKLVQPGFIISQRDINKKYKFWIMVETSYRERTEKEFEQAQEDPYGKDYQRRLCSEIIDTLLKDEWSQGLVLRSIDIIFSSQWDIVLTVYSENPQEVGNFITQYLRTHRSVTGTSTAWSPLSS